MTMNALTLGCLVFLVLIKNFYSNAYFIPIKLSDLKPTATEGSCVEIKCEVTGYISDDNGAYWFWLKDAKWDEKDGDYIGTVIYSTDTQLCAVSPDFANRVKYTGSLTSSWKKTYQSSSKPRCNILICSLKQSDSGEYSFRYKSESMRWSTNPNVTLKVTENPCPITFENPPAVMESEQITLTCSTLSSCPSNPEIEDLSLSSSQHLNHHQSGNRTTLSFTASWQDNGKVFSCKTTDNTDGYLIRNISVTVEYAPKNVSAEISLKNVREGNSVTLTCLAKGVPAPDISWVKNESDVVSTQAEWTITRIDASYSGKYLCKAQNKHGTNTSAPVTVDVTYVPEVEIKTTSSEVTEGDKMTLACSLIRSNPQPHAYTWYKNGAYKVDGQTYDVDMMKPEDRGSYTCTATNTVGSGTSPALQIRVKYRPRTTNIVISESNARAGQPFSFTCNTDAYPAPHEYSWYRFNNDKPLQNSLQWTSKTTSSNILMLEHVQRQDEANYKCNATNDIGTGDNSKPVNIQVLYPPTEPILSMADELTENMTTTISCTVESVPPSRLTVTRTSTSNSPNSKLLFSQPDSHWPSSNELQLTFNVTSAHDGVYTCSATNSEGSNTSKGRKLVVKYAPKDVRVQAQPAFVVNENKSLTLSCSARSYPQVNSFTWMKTTDGKEEPIWKTQKFTVKSASPSDIGWYSCKAKNMIGTGTSEKIQVNVKYAPKRINITRVAEKQERDGKHSVILKCNSDGYPPVKEYFWYKKGKEKDILEKKQHYTVFSDQPGDYYCVAKNEINEKASDPVTLFDGTFMMYLKIFLCLIFTLLIILLILFVYRQRKRNSIHQRSTQPCFGFLGWSNCVRRRNLIHQSILAEPFRSRDVLMPDQQYHPEAQQRQPHPDSTPASSVYSTVNIPAKKLAPAAQKPTRLQGGHTVDDFLNYASLSFENQQNNKQVKPEVDSVYAKVCKSKPPKKKEKDWLHDYENVSSTGAAKSPAPLDDDDDDSDSSEDDIRLNYTQVSFTPKAGDPRASSDTSSDTSSEDEIHYSDVKI